MNEIVDILDVKCTNGAIIGFVVPAKKYETTDINSMIKFLIPDEVKVHIIIDDIRLRTSLTD